MRDTLRQIMLDGGRWIALGVCVALIVVGWMAYRALPAVTEGSIEAEITPASWPESVAPRSDDWTVFERRPGGTPAQMGPLAQRYRLAGTFFSYPNGRASDARSSRQAILDDVRDREQHLVREGDDIGPVHVVSIFRDRVVLRGQAGDEELWLSFTGREDGPDLEVAAADEPPLRFEDMEALETSRFGKRIAENRWIMHRESLLDYVEEIQDDPERLAALFLAMEPDIRDGEVAGYQLRKQGEDLLYEAAGMREGDIVRKVNSMPMTSPERAEYFVSEFFDERVSAIVFDIERDGEEEKLIYLIR